MCIWTKGALSVHTRGGDSFTGSNNGDGSSHGGMQDALEGKITLDGESEVVS